MPVTTIYVLDAGLITISGGESLSNPDQGSGVQLNGRTITLGSNSWTPVEVDDSDDFFNDSDNSQTLDNPVTLNGIDFTTGRRVEAEYTVTVTDPDGNSYTLYGFNINEPGVTSYTTVEGLAFLGPVGGFPPTGVPLTVTGTSEGPGGSTTPYTDLATPPCFTSGTMIDVPNGQRLVETLEAGDLVSTLDHGAQVLRWVGKVHVSDHDLKMRPEFRPVQVVKDAFGPNFPARDMMVSPQHRLLLSGWRAEVFFGTNEILVPSKYLLNDISISRVMPDGGVTYIHLLFDAHEIITADNVQTESFFPGSHVMAGLPEATQQELLQLFPDLPRKWSKQSAARATIKHHEAKMLNALQ